jgi:hypothetical protein
MNTLSILQTGPNRQVLETMAGVSMLFLTRFRLGRILLHLIAMLGDRCARFHGSGIMRELPWIAAVPVRLTRTRTRAIGAILFASRFRSSIAS